MKSQKSDYLKYWRVVRHYIKVKYKVSQADLEILLFLHTEPYFTKDKFAEFNSVLSWDRKRFDRLNQEGWIEGMKTFRVGRRMKYSLSYRATRLVEEVYRILEGKEINKMAKSKPTAPAVEEPTAEVIETPIEETVETATEETVAEEAINPYAQGASSRDFYTAL